MKQIQNSGKVSDDVRSGTSLLTVKTMTSPLFGPKLQKELKLYFGNS